MRRLRPSDASSQPSGSEIVRQFDGETFSADLKTDLAFEACVAFVKPSS